MTPLIRWIEIMFGRIEVERLDTETTTSPNDSVLICRKCRDAAHVETVGNQVRSVVCPTCGVSLEGDAALQVVLDQARYLATSKVQNAFKKGLRGSKSVTYKPSRIKKPSGPFAIGKPKR